MSTQWAAQFLVAAELERKNYTVSFTMGNHTPVADLMVGHPTGQQFWVDVKGLASPNAWWGKPKPDRRDLFYVLVLIGSQRQQDRFFILRQADFNNLIREYEESHPTAKKLGGFNWRAPHRFENLWETLPEWQ
jgi:hypothetical protein